MCFFFYIVNFLTVSRLPNATVIIIHKLIAFFEFLYWAGNSLDLAYFQRFSEQKPTMNETQDRFIRRNPTKYLKFIFMASVYHNPRINQFVVF